MSDLFRFAGKIWGNLDRASGGLLPGGGTPNPVIQRITQAQNPTRQAAVEAVRFAAPVIRSTPIKTVRDAVLNPLTPVIRGVPGRTFAQVMTGGTASGRPVQRLDPSLLPHVKRAVVENWRPSNVIPNNSIQYNLYNTALTDKLERSSQYSGDYSDLDSLRDAQNTLGSFGAVRVPGGIRIIDKWKVDEPYREETYQVLPDLKEGGKVATDIYRFARDAGLYTPIEYDVTIPQEDWDAIEVPTSKVPRRF